MIYSNSHIELINLFWTTAGIFPGEGEISPHDFRERVEASAKAGFKGIGIWQADLEHTLKKRSLSEIKMILEDNGIKHIELEFLTDWFLDGPKKTNSDNIKRKMFQASEALNARHIKVGDFNNTPCSMPRIIEAFAQLCREAEDYGAVIAFEFMPSAMIDNLKDSLTLVKKAAANNGGLALDIAHLIKQGISCDLLKDIPLQYIISLELNDGTLPGSKNHDPSRERRFCGEGEFDLKGFVRCAFEIGYRGPWAVEVFSREMLGLALDDLNSRAFKTTMALFND